MAPQVTLARAHAVILAGGSGVRFWPRSRARRPKQLLSPLGGATLLRRTYERLAGIFRPEQIWALTNRALVSEVRRELPELRPRHVVAEPERRNTAPAAGLATALVGREDPDAFVGVFPADHHIEKEETYAELVQRAIRAAEADSLVVLGIRPSGPETGYGYIEFPPGTPPGAPRARRVVRFREKPDLKTAERFLASGRFYWNSGQFFWRVPVLMEELRKHLPGCWKAVRWIADGPQATLARRLEERYGTCERVSLDHGVLERSDRVRGFAAPGLGWTDLGSWSALHGLLPADDQGNSVRTAATIVDSRNNLVDVPGRHVALVGVNDLVIVETDEALLVCSLSNSQEVAAVVRRLRAAGRNDLA